MSAYSKIQTLAERVAQDTGCSPTAARRHCAYGFVQVDGQVVTNPGSAIHPSRTATLHPAATYGRES